MPRSKKAYGWKDGNSYFLSLLPRASNGARNVYASPTDALRDAHGRGIAIEWENVAEIDGHGHQ
jgi:hypothetical protein